MSNFFTDSSIKAILAVLCIIGLIIGFFLDKVSAEAFMGIVTSVIGYYFHNEQIKKLNDKLDAKDDQIQALSVNKPKIVDLE